jgi:hypothetical protein
MTSIELFKTNVDESKTAQDIIGMLQQTFPGCRISIDLHDCDKVLRLEGMQISKERVKELVQQHGFFCNELE